MVTNQFFFEILVQLSIEKTQSSLARIFISIDWRIPRKILLLVVIPEFLSLVLFIIHSSSSSADGEWLHVAVTGSLILRGETCSEALRRYSAHSVTAVRN